MASTNNSLLRAAGMIGKYGSSIVSRTKQRKAVAKSHNESHAHKGDFYTVTCETHGTMGLKGTFVKSLRVRPPESRRQRMGGCPRCRSINQ